MESDHDYPGTAVERMRNIRDRVRSLTSEQLSTDWPTVRRHLLWAGGLRDIDTPQGRGYTGHCFNDHTHCDLTAMQPTATFNENDGRLAGLVFSNQLGPAIRQASLPELGPGGSWTTCMSGCDHEPPRDVAHVQFQARIAFKLIW